MAFEALSPENILDSGKKVFKDTLNNMSKSKAPLSDEEAEQLRRQQYQRSSERDRESGQYWAEQESKSEKELSPVFKSLREGDATTNTMELMRDDDELRYRQVKQLTHDLSKIHSAEQGVIDFFDRREASQADPTMLTPAEATAFGREHGVDLKYSKNVTRGEVMFAVEKNKYKESLESQLAYYNSSGRDFSTMQKIAVLGSAISGSVGAAELLATTAISLVLPEIGLATVARLSRAGAVGSEALQGINAAYRTSRAMKLAQRYENTANLMRTAGTAAEAEGVAAAFFMKADSAASKATRLNNYAKGMAGLAKSSDETANLWYNITNQSRFMGTLPGESVPLGVQSALFAGDFAASSSPFITIAGYNSAANQTKDYGFKEAALETLLAGTLGAAMPVIGRFLGKGFRTTTDVVGGLVDNMKEVKLRATNQNIMKGVDISAVDSAANAAIRNAEHIASGLKEPPNSILRQAELLQGMNISSDEFLMNVKYVADSIVNGRVPRLENLPQKSIAYTWAHSDVVNSLRNLPREELQSLDAFLIKQTSDRSGFSKMKINGDGGLLGNGMVSAPTETQARELLADIYTANMFQDADAYVRASARIEGMQAAEMEMYDLVSRYRQQVRSGAGSSAEGHIPIRQELEDILGKLYHGEKYVDALERARIVETEQIMKGTGELDKEAIDILDDVRKRASEFIKTKQSDQGVVFENLNHSKTSPFIEDLREMAQVNSELLNADDVFLNRFSSPEEMLQKIQSGELSTEDVLTNVLNAPITPSRELMAKVQDVQVVQNRVFDAKDEFKAMLETTESFQDMQRGIEIVTQKIAQEDPSYKNFFTELTDKISRMDKVFDRGFDDFKVGLMNKFNEDPALTKLVREWGRYQSPQAIRSQLFNRANSPLRNAVTELFVDPLRQEGIKVTDRMLDDTLERFFQTMSKDPAMGEKLLRQVDIPTEKTMVTAEGITEKVQTDIAKLNLLSEIVDPLIADAQKVMLNEQYNAVKTMTRAIETFDVMHKNPLVASEALLSRFTMTPYNLKGSAESIENVVNLSRQCRTNIVNRLRQLSPGTAPESKMMSEVDLVSVMDAPSNRWDIQRHRIAIREYGKLDKELANKLGIDYNDHYNVIAQAIADEESRMISKLQDEGSLRTSMGTQLNSSKFARAEYLIPENEVVQTKEALNNVVRGLDPSTSGKFAAALDSLKYPNNSARDRASHYFFNELDLDKMYNAKGTFQESFNEIRDSIMDGSLAGKIARNEMNIEDVTKSMEYISSRINRSIIQSETGSANKLASVKALSSQYVDDFERSVHWKNIESEIKSSRLFGYDSLAEELDVVFNTQQRAYAVLRTTGPEPMSFTNSLVDAWNHYAVAESGKRFTAKDLEKIKIEGGKLRSLQNNVKLAAGIDSDAATMGVRLAKMIADTVTAPMLVKAGVKSLTDIPIGYQWLVTNGLADCSDLNGFGRTLNSVKNILTDKELRTTLFYTQALKGDEFVRMLTNNPLDSLGKLQKEAPWIDKAEQFSRNFSTMMINRVGFVEPITNQTRKVNSVMLMRAVADAGKKDFKALGERAQNMLKRHDIGEADWEFLRKHCVEDAKSYFERVNGTKHDGVERGFSMFFADNMADKVTDKEIISELTARGVKDLTQRNVDRFRQDLLEKGSIMLNTGALEMTTIPSQRVMSILTAGHDKNSGAGALFSMLTKYQSFSLSQSMTHYGRRLAQHVDTSDMAGIRAIHELFGNPTAAAFKAGGDAMWLLGNIAFWQFMVDNAANMLTGNTQGLWNEKGEFNSGKVIDPIINSTGVLGPVLDGILEIGMPERSRKGSQLPAFPAYSAIRTYMQRPIKAAQAEDGSISAALAQDAAQFTGLSTSVYTAYFWNMYVGAWLDQEAKGAKAYQKMLRGRRREGFDVQGFKQTPELFGGVFE